MTEASLALDLVEALKVGLPGYVILKLADRVTSGIPDIIVTGNRHVTWWEVKYLDPEWIDRGIQRHMVWRLWLAGHNTFYVVYDRPNDKTRIVRPDRERPYVLEAETQGFDHGFVVNFVRNLHLGSH